MAPAESGGVADALDKAKGKGDGHATQSGAAEPEPEAPATPILPTPLGIFALRPDVPPPILGGGRRLPRSKEGQRLPEISMMGVSPLAKRPQTWDQGILTRVMIHLMIGTPPTVLDPYRLK